MSEDATSKSEKEEMLAYMARRASSRAFYLASALETYKQIKGFDEVALAKFLGIAPNQLSLLALCSRPDVTDKARFGPDVKTIAAKFNIKLGLLAKLLREVAAYEANQQSAITTPEKFLMAALDRETEEPQDD